MQESSHQKLIYSGQLLNDSARLKDILRQCSDSEDQAYTVHLVCTPQKTWTAKVTDQTGTTENTDVTRNIRTRTNVQNQSHENANVTTQPQQMYSPQQYFDPQNSQQLAWMQAYTHYFTQYMQL